ATPSEIGMNSLVIMGALTPVQWGLIAVAALFPLVFGPLLLGAIFIRERRVGVVVKRFGSRSLLPGQLIALDGESGYQADTLPPGLHFGSWRWQYRIITVLFIVITSATASQHGMFAEQLLLQRVEPDQVGIVTTLDGRSIDAGEIAGSTIAGHDNFQNAQAFLDGSGRRGLQEQILL